MANRIRFTTAAQVVEAFPGAAGDLGEVPPDVSPLDHLAALAAGENLNPAVIFAALALPKRESVWWGCLALRGMGNLDDRTREGLRLAEAWVRQPEEEERRAAGGSPSPSTSRAPAPGSPSPPSPPAARWRRPACRPCRPRPRYPASASRWR